MKTIPFQSRRVLAAAGLTFSLLAAGCGDDTEGSSALQPPITVHVGSGDGTAALGTDAALAGDASAAGEADRLEPRAMLAPWVVYEYVLGDRLPTVPGEANGWHYESGAAPDGADVQRIADALGVTGDLTASTTEQGGGWRIGPDDGSAPALYVSSDGQLSWWYSPGWTDGTGRGGVAVSSGCAVPVDVEPAPDLPASTDAEQPGDAVVSDPLPANDTAVDETTDSTPTPAVEEPDECVYEEPTPPEGILSPAEAETRARELLSKIGVDPGAVELETWADTWSASVTAWVTFGDIKSPVSYSFGFGENGNLDWANGVLASPVEVGPYPLVSIDAAVDRMREGYGGWGGPVPMLAEDDSLAAADVAIDAPVCEPESADCPVDGPQEVTVTLTDVRLDLWWAWEVDGSVWLLPAYTFTGDNGGVFTVPAVTDEYLVFDDAADGAGVSEGSVEAPLPAVDADGPVTGGATDPGTVPEAPAEETQELVAG